jgi:hypothetical protein
MSDQTKELIAVLRACAAKLRQMGGDFNSPNFTDRYGDGPEMVELADRARQAILKAEGHSV